MYPGVGDSLTLFYRPGRTRTIGVTRRPPPPPKHDAPVTRGRMRTQFPLPHGPKHDACAIHTNIHGTLATALAAFRIVSSLGGFETRQQGCCPVEPLRLGCDGRGAPPLAQAAIPLHPTEHPLQTPRPKPRVSRSITDLKRSPSIGPQHLTTEFATSSSQSCEQKTTHPLCCYAFISSLHPHQRPNRGRGHISPIVHGSMGRA